MNAQVTTQRAYDKHQPASYYEPAVRDVAINPMQIMRDDINGFPRGAELRDIAEEWIFKLVDANDDSPALRAPINGDDAKALELMKAALLQVAKERVTE